MPAVTPEKGYYMSADGTSRLACYFYVPENPRAVIQLSHGMCEYVERYAATAEYFCSQGFIFCGNDHIGHGNTAPNADELGYIGSYEYLIADLHTVNAVIHKKYPGLPVIMLGHSMGSFAARLYISRYENTVDGAVISGTAGPYNPTSLGKFLALNSQNKHGTHYRDPFLKKTANRGYTKKFGKDARETAWLTSVVAEQEKYEADPFCNYLFTADGYYNLFDMLEQASLRFDLRRNLPLLLISGKDDPVGNYGKGVKQVYRRYKSAGITDLTLRLWEGGRHELFNEAEPIKSEVRKTVTDWINSHI